MTADVVVRESCFSLTIQAMRVKQFSTNSLRLFFVRLCAWYMHMLGKKSVCDRTRVWVTNTVRLESGLYLGLVRNLEFVERLLTLAMVCHSYVPQNNKEKNKVVDINNDGDDKYNHKSYECYMF